MGLTGKDYIIINGVSSDTVGLYIDTPPVPPIAQQRYTDYQTGTDTDAVSPDDTFENIKVSVTAYQFFPENFDNRAVYNFVKNPKTLQTSRFDDWEYRVQKLLVSAPESQHDGKRIRYRFDFECKPFKYAIENHLGTISAGTITNSGNRYSRPVWLIEGSGDISLTVNGETFTISGVDGSTCIDCEKMIAYTQSTIITPNTTGKFPFLASGANSVSWSGNITKVMLKKNERWY